MTKRPWQVTLAASLMLAGVAYLLIQACLLVLLVMQAPVLPSSLRWGDSALVVGLVIVAVRIGAAAVGLLRLHLPARQTAVRALLVSLVFLLLADGWTYFVLWRWVNSMSAMLDHIGPIMMPDGLTPPVLPTQQLRLGLIVGAVRDMVLTIVGCGVPLLLLLTRPARDAFALVPKEGDAAWVPTLTGSLPLPPVPLTSQEEPAPEPLANAPD